MYVKDKIIVSDPWFKDDPEYSILLEDAMTGEYIANCSDDKIEIKHNSLERDIQYYECEINRINARLNALVVGIFDNDYYSCKQETEAYQDWLEQLSAITYVQIPNSEYLAFLYTKYYNNTIDKLLMDIKLQAEEGIDYREIVCEAMLRQMPEYEQAIVDSVNAAFDRHYFGRGKGRIEPSDGVKTAVYGAVKAIFDQIPIIQFDKTRIMKTFGEVDGYGLVSAIQEEGPMGNLIVMSHRNAEGLVDYVGVSTKVM